MINAYIELIDCLSLRAPSRAAGNELIIRLSSNLSESILVIDR